jgi:nucleoside-diphosphate-sugar epimerase
MDMIRNKSSCALITGATGTIGPRVVESFHQVGYRIRTLSMDPPGSGLFPTEVEVLMGDVTDPYVVKSAIAGVDIVIHLAALLHIVNLTPELHEKYEGINVGGTGNIVQAAVQAGVKRVLFFSTIAVYGHSNGDVFTEDSPPRPDTLYAQTKLAAERIVLNAKRSNGLPLGTVLRFGAIYGPRIKGNYLRLLQSLARGRFIPIGNGYNRRTLIYDRDAAQAAVLAAQHPAAAGKIYNVSDGQYHTLNEIIKTMCEALGRYPPRVSLPVGPVRLAAGILEDVGRMIGYNSPIGRTMVNKYTEDIAVDSQRIQTELGFQPQFDLLTGWRETVQQMRQMSNLSFPPK